MLFDSFVVLKTLTLQAPVLTRQFDAAITVLLQNYTVGAIHFFVATWRLPNFV